MGYTTTFSNEKSEDESDEEKDNSRIAFTAHLGCKTNDQNDG